MDNAEDIIKLNEFKIQFDSEVEKCKKAIDDHRTYAEVKIMYVKINELEDSVNILRQNFLS
jgi:hypothetical protein